MASVRLVCARPGCETVFWRSEKEHRRSLKVGRREFCSRSCCAKVCNNEHLRIGNPQYLVPDNLRDRYTPFRWFMARAVYRRDRKGDTDLTLEFLSALWERQGGRCPFTGWPMLLPKSTEGKWEPGPKWRRASLDRIDNAKGYAKGNVRFVSVIANMARQDYGDEAVYEFCEAVVECHAGVIRIPVLRVPVLRVPVLRVPVPRFA